MWPKTSWRVRDLTYPLSLQFAEFNFDAQEPNMVHYGFDITNLPWYPVGDIPSLVHLPPPEFPFDFNFPLLSPPTTISEQFVTPSPPHPPSLDLPIMGPPAAQLPVSAQPPTSGQLPVPAPPTLPLAPPAPAWQPTSLEVDRFDFCPYTENGQVCGFVSWKSSGNKTIERHMKREHFKLGSSATAWKCPNPRCKNKGRAFARKDSLINHRRKSCDPWHSGQDPNFIPLPHIGEGNDTEVKRWITAAHGQRNAIKKRLRTGTPWSIDLLQPTHP